MLRKIIVLIVCFISLNNLNAQSGEEEPFLYSFFVEPKNFIINFDEGFIPTTGTKYTCTIGGSTYVSYLECPEYCLSTVGSCNSFSNVSIPSYILRINVKAEFYVKAFEEDCTEEQFISSKEMNYNVTNNNGNVVLTNVISGTNVNSGTNHFLLYSRSILNKEIAPEDVVLKLHVTPLIYFNGASEPLKLTSETKTYELGDKNALKASRSNIATCSGIDLPQYFEDCASHESLNIYNEEIIEDVSNEYDFNFKFNCEYACFMPYGYALNFNQALLTNHFSDIPSNLPTPSNLLNDQILLTNRAHYFNFDKNDSKIPNPNRLPTFTTYSHIRNHSVQRNNLIDSNIITDIAYKDYFSFTRYIDRREFSKCLNTILYPTVDFYQNSDLSKSTDGYHLYKWEILMRQYEEGTVVDNNNPPFVSVYSHTHPFNSVGSNANDDLNDLTDIYIHPSIYGSNEDEKAIRFSLSSQFFPGGIYNHNMFSSIKSLYPLKFINNTSDKRIIYEIKLKDTYWDNRENDNGNNRPLSCDKTIFTNPLSFESDLLMRFKVFPKITNATPQIIRPVLNRGAVADNQTLKAKFSISGVTGSRAHINNARSFGYAYEIYGIPVCYDDAMDINAKPDLNTLKNEIQLHVNNVMSGINVEDDNISDGDDLASLNYLDSKRLIPSLGNYFSDNTCSGFYGQFIKHKNYIYGNNTVALPTGIYWVRIVPSNIILPKWDINNYLLFPQYSNDQNNEIRDTLLNISKYNIWGTDSYWLNDGQPILIYPVSQYTITISKDECFKESNGDILIKIPVKFNKVNGDLPIRVKVGLSYDEDKYEYAGFDGLNSNVLTDPVDETAGKVCMEVNTTESSVFSSSVITLGYALFKVREEDFDANSTITFDYEVNLSMSGTDCD